MQAGLLKVVWNLGWFSRTELVVPGPNLTDEAWHRVKVSRLGQEMTVTIDQEVTHSQVQYLHLHLQNLLCIKYYAFTDFLSRASV